MKKILCLVFAGLFSANAYANCSGVQVSLVTITDNGTVLLSYSGTYKTPQYTLQSSMTEVRICSLQTDQPGVSAGTCALWTNAFYRSLKKTNTLSIKFAGDPLGTYGVGYPSCTPPSTGATLPLSVSEGPKPIT